MMKKIMLIAAAMLGSIGSGHRLMAGDQGNVFNNECCKEEYAGPWTVTSKSDPLTIANKYISAHLADWGLTQRDIAELVISDQYTDRGTGITRIYFLQRYDGIPVYNAIVNINMTREGIVFHAGQRLVGDLDGKIKATVPKLGPAEAVSSVVSHLNLVPGSIQLKKSPDDTEYIIDKSNFANEDITAALCYQPFEGKVHLAWNIRIAPLGTNDVWNTRVDAVTGKILEENNWTLYCQDGKAVNGEENSGPVHPDHFEIPEADIRAMSVSGQAHYKVWPFPYESPNSGPQTLVTDPADAVASPFGWHDTDGQPGPEYTFTRGNNAHVFLDRDGTGQTNHDEPDGGPNLQFDYPFDPALEPEQYVDASQVNLFYWANFMHDFTYHFGFDEAAGNFQQNNYGHGGNGNDYLQLMAQYGANIDSVNNASYTHRLDGISPFIRMRLFHGFHNYLTVHEPAGIAGKYRTGPPSAGWGAGSYVTTTPVTADVVIVDDGIEEPYSNDACEPILNAAELNGKIALVERGGCQFGYKALQVQNAGAIGMICGNIDDDNYTMNPGQYGAQVHIPVVLIGASDCQTLKQFIAGGLKVSLVDTGDEIPQSLDSDLDNTMIIHEYGHGISERIVGGPSTSCLDNAEQMGEGWSDFFALAVTVKQGDTKLTRRGFATYSLKDPSTGKGFRRYPYSTDLDIMPLTYGDVASNSEVHDLGQIWAAMIWDMYWALVDQYGWNADPYDPGSGNYRAIRLVIEGMKNIPCSPGFVDARNAIIAADESLYDGMDVCTIWKAFARRGLGYSADQGSPFNAGDQKEAFDLPPTCTDQLLVKKSVTDFIHPGDEIKVSIRIGNFKNDLITHVVVNDEIPEGTHYKMNSSNIPAHVQGNMIAFDAGHMPSQDTQTISYTLLTDPEKWSERIYLDEVTTQSNPKWLAYTLGDEASNDWEITSELPAHSGNEVWHTTEAPEQSRQVLELNPDVYTFHVDVNHPVLRFYHRMECSAGMSGGVVDVREVGTSRWEEVDHDMLRNGYTTKMDYRTFLIPGVYAFSGNSGDEYRASYIDLSPWAGKDIQIRFRFGTIPNHNYGAGWLIDDIEFMDMLSYNGEACVMTDQGDVECVYAPESGTIVESREHTTSVTAPSTDRPFSLFPNPASDHITLQWNDHSAGDVNIMMESLDGKVITSKFYHGSGQQPIRMATDNIPPGLYLVKINTDHAQAVVKVMVQQ